MCTKTNLKLFTISDTTTLQKLLQTRIILTRTSEIGWFTVSAAADITSLFVGLVHGELEARVLPHTRGGRDEGKAAICAAHDPRDRQRSLLLTLHASQGTTGGQQDRFGSRWFLTVLSQIWT